MGSEYVENKDREGVTKLKNQTEVTEFIFLQKLNSNMPEFLIKQGYVFEMQTSGGMYEHHDMEFVQITKERDRILIARVEFEYGYYQDAWDKHFPPPDIWQGLNLMTRKDYCINFDIFIKSSPTYNSFFAVDCREHFIDNKFLRYIRNFDTSHTTGIKTNDIKFEIPWEAVNKHLFSIDPEIKHYKKGNICLVEDENWSFFYKFLYYMFINGN